MRPLKEGVLEHLDRPFNSFLGCDLPRRGRGGHHIPSFQFLSGMRPVSYPSSTTRMSLSIPFWDATAITQVRDCPHWESFNSFLGCDKSLRPDSIGVSRLCFQFLSGMRLFGKKQEVFNFVFFQFLSGMRLVLSEWNRPGGSFSFQFLSGMRLDLLSIWWSTFAAFNSFLGCDFDFVLLALLRVG